MASSRTAIILSTLPRSFVTDADQGRNWKASADEARRANAAPEAVIEAIREVVVKTRSL